MNFHHSKPLQPESIRKEGTISLLGAFLASRMAVEKSFLGSILVRFIKRI
jgi:hypothetical protein